MTAALVPPIIQDSLIAWHSIEPRQKLALSTATMNDYVDRPEGLSTLE